ncbi:hypothetical protein HOY82DRAFT_240539 [Tuber indicum]|nr:hypothetical protein HOY82DRAFT_240539 [Tuber indicum]
MIFLHLDGFSQVVCGLIFLFLFFGYTENYGVGVVFWLSFHHSFPIMERFVKRKRRRVGKFPHGTRERAEFLFFIFPIFSHFFPFICLPACTVFPRVIVLKQTNKQSALFSFFFFLPLIVHTIR